MSRHRIATLIFAAALGPACAFADAAPPPPVSGGTKLLLGYYDPATGTFKIQSSPAPATTTKSGTIKIVASVQLNASIPSDAVISLISTIQTNQNSPCCTRNEVDPPDVTMKRTGAHSAALTLTIPYLWLEPSGKVQLNAVVGFATSVTSNGQTETWSSEWDSTATLPADGQTLTLAVAGAL